MLLDRLAERAALGRLLDAARAGRSGALVMRGLPGVGKTALLEYAIESASGFRVARAVGVEWEMELAFAALQQLCAPMLDRADRLPGPQREALGVAFGLRAGDAPDRFLVGLAALSLLSEVAGERPLLCVIDDAQWLDRASAQALAFVARRLLADPVALLVAAREPGEEFARLPELPVPGLGDGDARELLGSVIRGPLDERVRDRIVAETRGNPLALLELPRGLSLGALAGGFGLLDAPGLSGRIEDSFRRRLEALPDAAQRLLLVAAAEPTGEPALVWRAAGGLGIGAEAAAAAEADGLLAIGGRVTFRHPLVRSAVYRAASAQDRRAVHRALAEATDPQADPDRRAWHRAQATLGPDDEVAGELEHSAGRAQARGGLAAAAAFLERSAALTLEPARQAERALAAAQAKYQAGAFEAALGLLDAAETGPLGELQRAQADLLRGQIAFASRRGSDAPPLLLKAARQFEPLDVRLARETYLDALSAVVFAGRLALGAGSVREVAEAARAAPPPTDPPRPPDLLLDGLASLITEGWPTGAPMLKRAVSAFRSADISREEGQRWLWLACRAGVGLRELGRAVRPPGQARPGCRRAHRTPHRLQHSGGRADPATLLDRLAASFDALGTGTPDLPDRQQTLRATVEWSVGLLDDAERSLLEILAVFAGGWTIEAAARMAGLDDDRSLELAEALVRHSLVQLDSGRDGPRCRMLETIRQFVAERLAARPDVAEVERRHADYYRALAEQADRPMRGAAHTEWLERLEAETGNLAAAVRWYLAHDPAPLPHLFRVLWPFWFLRDPMGEGRSWVGQLLPAADSLDPQARAELQWTALVAALEVGDDDAALAARERLGPLLAGIGDPYLHAVSQLAMAWSSPILGDLDGALRTASVSLDRLRSLDEPFWTALAVGSLGAVETAVGHYDDALLHLGEAGDLGDRFGSAWLGAWSRVQVGTLFILRGHLDEARARLDEALNLSLSAHSTRSVTLAALLAGAAEGLRRPAGLRPWPTLRRAEAELVVQALQALGAGRFDQVFASGSRLSRPDAVAAARGLGR